MPSPFTRKALSLRPLPLLATLSLLGAVPVPPATPRLASVRNFRDVAGPDAAHAYRTADHRVLRRGVLYRSDRLEPAPADAAVLDGLGLAVVYDLRTPGEIARNPDRTPAGARWVNVNLMGTEEPLLTIGATAEETLRNLEEGERQFVLDPGFRSRLGGLLRAMAGTDGPQLFHCASGKDRTGWVAAVLQSLCGVPEAEILQDYLATNAYTAEAMERDYEAMAKARGRAYADAFRPVFGVAPDTLRAGLEQARRSYGSMDGYLERGLGLDAATRTRLARKLLEAPRP